MKKFTEERHCFVFVYDIIDCKLISSTKIDKVYCKQLKQAEFSWAPFTLICEYKYCFTPLHGIMQK